MKQKMKRSFAAFLALVMCLGMLPTSVFAAAGSADGQIEYAGGTKYYNADGAEVSASALGDNGAVVALSKNIATTEVENVFDITLMVETTLEQEENFTTTKTTYYDSAVVLTIDQSGTMRRDENKMDGKYYVTVAKEKALEFLAQYAASAEASEKRNLAVVTFDTDAWLKLNWTDVNTTDGYTAARNAIQGITVADKGSPSSDQVCTNFDGGLMLTRNLLNASTVDKAHSWAIILSDGAPTVTSDDSTDVGKITSTFWNGQGYQAAKNGGGWTHPEEVRNNLTRTREIAQKASVYMIGVGGLMNVKLFYDACYGTSNGSRTDDVEKNPAAFAGITPAIDVANMTTAEWLTALVDDDQVKGSYISATNTKGLASAFGAIVGAIESSTQSTPNTITSSAWNTVDPIDANASTPYVEFMGFYNDDGYKGNGVDKIEESDTVHDGDTAFVTENDEITDGYFIDWDLKQSNYTEANGVYTYSIKYRVRLANEGAEFAENAALVTNGTTTFSYQTVTNNVFGHIKTVNFPIPQVEGYLSEFSFTKVESDGSPLAGAKFSLTHSSSCSCSDVTIAAQTGKESGSDGAVTFSGIPSGHKYVLKETSAPSNYTMDGTDEYAVSVDMDVVTAPELAAKGWKIINAPETTSVQVTKVWSDSDNQDGNRPSSITVKLLCDGTECASVTLSNNNGWTHTFTNLPKANDGKAVAYTVEEVSVDGYSSNITGDAVNGFTITNSYTPGETSVSVSKVWSDGNNQDNTRPASIQVQLYANDEPEGDPVTLTSGNWSYTWSNLPEKSNGGAIQYSVDEVAVPDGYTKNVTNNGNAYTITNSYTPETITINGSKTWNDGNNQDGTRPASITIILKANGSEVARKVVTASDNWQWTFADQPKYSGGQEISYTISEEAVSGYTTTVNGYDVTNSYTPGETSVSVNKVWSDNNNQDGTRPASIQVQLYANDEPEGDPVTLTSGNWSYTWSNLPEKSNGGAIQYSVDEVSVPDGYTKNVTNNGNAYTITNSYTPETITISGSKTWNDSDNQDGTRPASITIILKADGSEVARKIVTASDNWQWTFAGQPKYNGGQEINYTIDENAVSGYTTTVNGYDVINSYTPGQTSVSVSKVWNDGNNQDGTRPASIQVQLYADGSASGIAVTLDNSNGWSYTWNNLPEKSNGSAIQYSVDEVAVPAGYTKGVTNNGNAYTITNTREIVEPDPITIRNSAIVKLDAMKTMDGQPAGGFHFILVDEDGNIVSSTYSNNRGKVSFGIMSYDRRGVYTYSVYEVAGSDKGIIYDESVYDVTVNVSRNKTVVGHITTIDFDADVTITKNGQEVNSILFENFTKQPDPVSLALSAEKTLDGAPATGFQFKMTGNGVDATASSNNGVISFPAIKYETAGEYVYTITEVAGSDAEIIYDGSVYTVTVSVREGANRNLTAEVTSILKDGEAAEKVLFQNETYIEYEEILDEDVPLGDIPETGDASALWMVVSTLSGTALAGVSFLNRKKREDEE